MKALRKNFKPRIYYVGEQKATTEGIKMFRRVKPILITKQEIIFLPKAKPTILKGVHVVFIVRYNELRLNQQSGSIVRWIPRD